MTLRGVCGTYDTLQDQISVSCAFELRKQSSCTLLTDYCVCAALHPTEAASPTLVGGAVPCGSALATSCLPLQAAPSPPLRQSTQQVTGPWSLGHQTHLLTPVHPYHTWEARARSTVRQTRLSKIATAANTCLPVYRSACPTDIINMTARLVSLTRRLAL